MPAISLLTYNTIRQLMRLGHSYAESLLLIQEAVGLAGILALTKFGANQYIADRQNNMMNYAQKMENYLGGTVATEKFIDYVGGKMGISESKLTDYKLYARADHYKADRGTIEIFELSTLHGFLAYQKSGGNPVVAFGAFVATSILMSIRRKELEMEGKEFSLAKSFPSFFGKTPILKTICQWLSPNDIYENEDGEYGFGNDAHEDFVNDIFEGNVDEGLKQFEQNKEIVIDNPIKNKETDNLLENEWDNGFGSDGIEQQKHHDELMNDINKAKEDWHFEPIIDNAKDGFKPFFDNSPTVSTAPPTPTATPTPTPTPTISIQDLKPPVIIPVVIHEEPKKQDEFLWGLFGN